MKLYASLVAVGLLAIGVLAAGCGSSNDDSSTSTTAISKADFEAQGNQICKQGNAEINQAGQQLGKNATQSQFEDFVASTLVPNIQKQVDGVKALGAPAGEEDQVNQLVATVQGDIDELKADPSKIRDDSLFKEANQQSVALGLNECAGS
jgi:hypothetical protein